MSGARESGPPAGEAPPATLGPVSAVTTPDVSIITVSWNVRDLLRACLHSIAATGGELGQEMIVVDGGSEDGSPDMVAQEFPDVRLLRLEENVGFPKGNNLGMAGSRGRNLLLLNPDTEVTEGAVATMAAYLDQHADVGVVGPTLLNPDGTLQSSRRRFPTLATAFVESTWLQRFTSRRILDRYYMREAGEEVSVDVDWLVGACLMVRRQVWQQVGGMDEAYFMYSEELDWCRRIKDAGWRVVYLPAARIIHHVGMSSQQAVTSRHINFQRAKLRYFHKHHGPWLATALRIFLLLSYAWQLVMESAKGVVGHKRDLRWQRVRSYWRVLRSGLPPAGLG